MCTCMHKHVQHTHMYAYIHTHTHSLSHMYCIHVCTLTMYKTHTCSNGWCRETNTQAFMYTEQIPQLTDMHNTHCYKELYTHVDL